MGEKVKLTADHMHEALDRSHVVSSMFDQFLVNHPAVMGDPGLKDRADEASEVLANFYQACGKAMHEFDESDEIIVIVEL